MNGGWITIPNWRKFQHYTDRDPTWVKLYLDLNSRDEWLELSTAARGMLTTIWVEYARSRGHLRVQKVMQLCGKSARSSHLDSLQEAGFVLISASKPLALTRSREKDVPTGRSDARKKTSRKKGPDGRKVTGWRIVRGSHGITTIPDPFGTDPAPVEWRTP